MGRAALPVARLLLAACLALAGVARGQGNSTQDGVRAALLAQRDAVTNWAAFKAANNIQGWDEAAPDVCSWSGVNCTKDTREVFRLDWSCDNCKHCPLIGEYDFNVCAQPLAQGGLAPELATIPTLRQIFIKGQNLSGPLPGSWGDPGAFPRLEDLAMENNSLAGPLPERWGQPGSFPRVWRIWLDNNDLTGSLPASWGGSTAMQNLTWLRLHNNSLSGGIPAEWGGEGFAEMEACPSRGGLVDLGRKCEITLAGNENLCGPLPPLLDPLVCAKDAGAEEQDKAPCVPGPNGVQEIPCPQSAAGASPQPAPAATEPPPPAAAAFAAVSPVAAPVAPSPPPPPPPAPAPAAAADTASTGSSSGSSTNTGAIVGGVIGGVALLGVAAFVGGKWWGRRAGGWKKAPLEGQSKVSEAEMGTIKPTDTSGSNAAAYQPPQAPGAQPAAHAQGGMESVSYDRRP